jgi:hypothetical protein
MGEHTSSALAAGQAYVISGEGEPVSLAKAGKIVNARCRLRSSRTKLAAARWAICAFERQGHLVGTANGPPSGRPSQVSRLSILTEPHDELGAFIRSPRRPSFAERNVMERPIESGSHWPLMFAS